MAKRNSRTRVAPSGPVSDELSATTRRGFVKGKPARQSGPKPVKKGKKGRA